MENTSNKYASIEQAQEATPKPLSKADIKPGQLYASGSVDNDNLMIVRAKHQNDTRDDEFRAIVVKTYEGSFYRLGHSDPDWSLSSFRPYTAPTTPEAPEPAAGVGGDDELLPFLDEAMEKFSIITGLCTEQPGDGEGEMRSALRTIKSFAEAGEKLLLQHAAKARKAASVESLPSDALQKLDEVIALLDAASTNGLGAWRTNSWALDELRALRSSIAIVAQPAQEQGGRVPFNREAWQEDKEAWDIVLEDGTSVKELSVGTFPNGGFACMVGEIDGKEALWNEEGKSGHLFAGRAVGDLFMRPVSPTAAPAPQQGDGHLPAGLPAEVDAALKQVEACALEQGMKRPFINYLFNASGGRYGESHSHYIAVRYENDGGGIDQHNCSTIEIAVGSLCERIRNAASQASTDSSSAQEGQANG